MAIPTFQWAAGGRPVSPEEAARQRRVAEALIGRTQSPARNWAEGLSHLAGAYTGTVLQDRAAEAEQAGAAEAAALFNGLNSGSPEQDIIAAMSNPWASDQQQSVAAALLGQQFQQQRGADTENFFGTLVPFQNPDGSISYGQLGNAGSFKPVDLPEGTQPAPTTRTVDTPTESIVMDVYGNELYRIPKDNRGAARDKEIGTGEGAAIAGAPGDIAAGETALDLINQIRTSPELPWATGTSAGFGGNSIAGTGRFGFQQLVEQAKSGAFLTAIQEMRGLGSLSNAEGQTATAAVTRMNTALSTEDFLKAVDDYEAIIRRGIDRAKDRLGLPAGEPVATDEGWSEVPSMPGVKIRAK